MNHGELYDLLKLLWGPGISDSIFNRWKQGFCFEVEEPTALVQLEGGPCAVIAPVQAYIIKQIIRNKSEGDNWKQADAEEQNRLLVEALCEILEKAYGGSRYYYIQAALDDEMDKSILESNAGLHAYLHNHLRINPFHDIASLKAFLMNNVNELKSTFGILLFLYSVMYSRGLNLIREECCGTEEPLIDVNHGYGSQVITSLLITGRAVAYVFNGNQDIGGLTLMGIDKQSEVGFLTLLENLRLCEVGSYLKKPVYPVWVLGSETHITVLFSFEKKLAVQETRLDEALRVFREFDKEGNKFVSVDCLGPMLEKLNLFYDEEYVKIMVDKLDEEKIGIILLNTFMEEFFPEYSRNRLPDEFVIYHYNGLPNSNANGKVTYQRGIAVMLECSIHFFDLFDQLTQCMQSKWPNIDVRWDGRPPSLN